MSIKVTPDKYPEIIELYNREGKTAAYDLIRSQYGIKNPTCVMKRLKRTNELAYNPETDRFEAANCKEEDSIFLNLEELCHTKPQPVSIIERKDSTEIRTLAMENMIHTLIGDRLLEISKYVLLDPVSRRIMIDQTAMNSDGYQVIIN